MGTQIRAHIHASLHAIALLALFAAPALADRVVAQDGRIIAPKKARAEGAGYKLTFENGEIILPDKSLVRSVEIEGDMSDYVPANDDEKDKLAQGYVKYKSKWMSAPAYKEELRKEFEASKKRIEDIKAHSDWTNAWSRKTAHFLFKTDTSPELLEYYSDLLEAYYALQDQRLGIHPPPNQAKHAPTVNIYKSNEDFHAHAAAPDIGPSVLGYFWEHDNTLNFYHEYSEPAQSTWVALHECTHLLTYLVNQHYEPQIWLNEAIADYFGSSKVTRNKAGKLVIEPGQLQMDRVLTVQEALKSEASKTGESDSKSKHKGFEGRPFTKLEDLFMLSRDAFDGFQYAHAWSFVYFLNNFENGKYAKAFNSFYKGLYNLEKGVEAEAGQGGGRMVSPQNIRAFLLAKLQIKDVPQLEKDWRKFVADIPILGPEARLKRGIYSMRMGDFEQAVSDLNMAIDGGVKDPRAWSARGKALSFTGKEKEAIKDLRTAVEKDPLSSSFRYDLSSILCGITSTGMGGGHGGGMRVSMDHDGKKIKNDEAKKEAGLAMELDPENDYYREWFEGFE